MKKLILLSIIFLCGCSTPKFNPHVSEGFQYKWTADRYANNAQKAGYKVSRSYTANWYLTGAKYWVSVDKEEK